MRTGGWISDFVGELRIAEPEVFANDFFGASRLLAWKGGRFALGYPLGMPLGVDAGVAWQVYSAGALVAATTEPSAVVQLSDGLQWFEVLGIATHLAGAPQLNVLDRACGRRVTLAWAASASGDVAAYRIYHDNRTGTVDYTTGVAEVDAKPGGRPLATYAWVSGDLAGGAWRFGIRSVDAAGNVAVSPGLEAAVTLTPAPDPPAALACSYDAPTRRATLTWPAPTRWD